ncbi:MAG: VOC family protein [Clostridiales bacterium]|nr:VOC family protein [Clostridiales bacterium]
MPTKFAHTNIIASDWVKLSDFYIKAFDCKPVYPERDLSGPWIEMMTYVKNAVIKGIHLSLPGYEDGPTLEIFQYEPKGRSASFPSINRQGLGHIAFHVDDVAATLKKVLELGGKQYGQLVENQFEGLGLLTAAYAQDPEGNIIEIQNWKK